MTIHILIRKLITVRPLQIYTSGTKIFVSRKFCEFREFWFSRKSMKEIFLTNYTGIFFHDGANSLLAGSQKIMCMKFFQKFAFSKFC